MTPRNVRNFWIDCNIDGQASTLNGGPKNAGGGLCATIKQRDAGNVTTAFTIEAQALSTGELVLHIFDHDGKRIHQHITTR